LPEPFSAMDGTCKYPGSCLALITCAVNVFWGGSWLKAIHWAYATIPAIR
jgi:hypothetical protein